MYCFNLFCKCFLPVFFLACFTSSCKKEKLTGQYGDLVGEWSSIATIFNCGTSPGLPHDPGYKLELNKSGHYKLIDRESGKLKECGRVYLTSGNLRFTSLSKKAVLKNLEILHFTSDSLDVDRSGCNDDYKFQFVKIH